MVACLCLIDQALGQRFLGTFACGCLGLLLMGHMAVTGIKFCRGATPYLPVQ